MADGWLQNKRILPFAAKGHRGQTSSKIPEEKPLQLFAACQDKLNCLVCSGCVMALAFKMLKLFNQA